MQCDIIFGNCMYENPCSCISKKDSPFFCNISVERRRPLNKESFADVNNNKHGAHSVSRVSDTESNRRQGFHLQMNNVEFM